MTDAHAYQLTQALLRLAKAVEAVVTMTVGTREAAVLLSSKEP